MRSQASIETDLRRLPFRAVAAFSSLAKACPATFPAFGRPPGRVLLPASD